MSDFSDPERRTVRQPAYQRIAASLRNDILSGKLSPGDMLPTTEEFAAVWKASYFTAHTALKALVKEGWVQRIHGRGTYVAQPDKRFLHAGIFHSLNIWSDEETHFQRRLNDCLVEKFRALGKTTQIIIDSRPEDTQGTMFPPLAQAIFNRDIQCIVAPDVNSKSLPLLENLSIPVAFMTTRPNHPGVDFDSNSFLRGCIRSLADQGCRTIGFINNMPVMDGDFSKFMDEVERAGLKTQADWMIQPPIFQDRLQEFGFRAFRQLWKLPARPEGLMVYPDVAARGVILAALEASVRVPQEIRFAFHRNAYTSVLCPFPVTWAISDEAAAADGLIAAIKSQFAGVRPEHGFMPYTFEFDDAVRWSE